MQLNDANKIYEKIKKETGKSDEELRQKLEEIKTKYQGLLSEVGANTMLANKLNVNLDLKSVSSVFTISELSNSPQDSVSIYARVKSIPPVKTFKAKDGSDGKLQSIYIADSTGITKLNLWQDKAMLVKELSLEKNSLIFIKDAYVTSYNKKVELSLRYGGSIIKDPKNAPEVPKLKENYVDISDINSPSEESMDTIGRIVNIYPSKTFEAKAFKGEGTVQRKVTSFDISDGVKNIRCVAWDPWSSEIEKNYSNGDLIKLSDVYVKEGKYDYEIHINWNSTVIKNPKTEKNIPLLKDMLSLTTTKGKVSDLEADKSYILEGVIVSINRNNLRFFKCPNCGEKIHILNNEFICETCNDVVDPIVNLFGSMDIDDGSGIIKIVFFGDLVTKMFNIKKEDVKKELTEEDKLTIFDKLEDKLLGKKVSVSGRVKLNNFSSQLEMICNSIDVMEEAS